MKQFNRAEYLQAIKNWNKHHRIIGSNVEELYKQSLEAIHNSKELIDTYSMFVDVGAGSGILGAAWLERYPEKMLVLLEPRKKAVSFLQAHFGQFAKRVFVINERIEHVSRETLSSLEPNFCCGARAFSSEKPLEELLAISALKDIPFFTFFVAENEKSKKNYCLKRL